MDLSKIKGFQWDKGNTAHIAKHNVSPKEAEEVFFDKDSAQDEDLDHSTKEKRFLIIGKTEKGRLLYQIFTVRGEKIRVISSSMKKKLMVPKFKDEAVEADFWTNLDLSEYFEPSDFKRGVRFPNLKLTTRPITLRLPVGMIDRVKIQAHKMDIPYQSLIKKIIYDGLQSQL